MPDIPSESLQVYRSRSIAGGVNSWAHPIDIEDNESVELQNITTDTPGLRKKRMGTTIVATGITAGPIYGIGSRGNILYVVSASHDAANNHKRLWEWDGTGAQFTYIGALTGYTADGLYRLVQCWDSALSATDERAIVVIPPENVTGVGRWYYDGTALAQTHWGNADQPIGPEFEYFMNYGFAAGSRRSSVFMSNITSPLMTGFRTPSSQFLMGGDTDHKIVAIRGFRSREAVVFMTNRIEELVIGDPDLNYDLDKLQFGGVDGVAVGSPINYTGRRVIDTTIGCASRHSIAKVSEDLIFADQRGNIRSLARTALDASQGTKSLPLSIKIQSYIDRINGAALDQICATAYDRFYIVAFPLDGATEPNNVFVFDTVRKAWDGPWTGINPKCFKSLAVTAEGAAAADKLETVFAGTSETSEGRVIRLYRGSTDFGSSIEYKETTKRITGDVLELDKTWVRLEVIAVATDDVDVTIEANAGEAGWVTIGTMNLLGSSPQLPVDLTFTLGGTGLVIEKFSLERLPRSRDVQFRFTADATGEVKILGYSVFYFVDNLEWDN